MKFKRIIICVFLFLAYQNCKSQIKINSAEETADKLAKQMEVSNSEVLNVWTDLNNLYNIRNDEALKYSKIIESISKAKISYAKQLTSLIKKIKINNEIITSEKKFISYR
ncbi:MAG: hypothetical protein P4L45_12235 [Ignavibacteriaceae bacterium]|nr:hypothetical protein [Ignavibacteriaceae bacterium]